MKTEIGGDRLGSGNKQSVSLKNYERSTHDLGYIWRSSMASGTLVPFMSEVALPGDSFDIKLNCDVKTLPTVGPLFGSYKVQMDVFQCPMRLYQGKLHMNMLNIGMDMSQIKLPQLEMFSYYDATKGDNQQINSSSIYSYLNMRGLGRNDDDYAKREFNAVPYLAYWDIYKNYYANKQEERGFVVHNSDQNNEFTISYFNVIQNGIYNNIRLNAQTINITSPVVEAVIGYRWDNTQNEYGEPDINDISFLIDGSYKKVINFWQTILIDKEAKTITCNGYIGSTGSGSWYNSSPTIDNVEDVTEGEPQLTEFPLENIDEMRMDILQAVKSTTAFKIDKDTPAPYGLGLGWGGDEDLDSGDSLFYKEYSQEGLGIKTYQSDLFNNWISTEWIDGSNGINEVTAVSTAGNEFTIDSLNLANKVYNMLNRIAISGGSYDDWLDAVYTHERAKSCENPVYQGSLIKELAFEEVVSLGDTSVNGNEQPLGTLAGRGKLTSKHKGGSIRVKVDEPSYIIGIVSITPRVDYSQGNKWDTNLKTMNDLHKPSLDEIGYQDLVTDQMAWFGSEATGGGTMYYTTAGKQPAWINYMTNVNQTRGNFAVDGREMFMTLNRRYEVGANGIADVTTYVDPNKYNQIFAQQDLSSQNFWVQISNNITARRKMSAKVIPNL